MFVFGQEYKRSELHDKYGGQRQGGISTPSRHNFMMVFTGEQGRIYGYEDQWTDEGLFLLTGFGQHGDMKFSRGNEAIRHHVSNHKELYLLEYIRKGYVRYVGQMVCTGYRELRRPDIDGKVRKVLVFELMPMEAFDETIFSGDTAQEEEIWQLPINILHDRIGIDFIVGSSPSERAAMIRYRSNCLRIYVLRRANGICEACGNDAPFTNALDKPYLEPHHILRLSDNGPDNPRWVISLCPNCHRRAHYAQDRAKFNRELTQILAGKEKVKSNES